MSQVWSRIFLCDKTSDEARNAISHFSKVWWCQRKSQLHLKNKFFFFCMWLGIHRSYLVDNGTKDVNTWNILFGMYRFVSVWKLQKTISKLSVFRMCLRECLFYLEFFYMFTLCHNISTRIKKGNSHFW